MKSPTWNQILHILFFFLFFFINYLRCTNAKDIFLNCGSSSDYSIGLDGHKWTGDSCTGSKFLASEQSNETSIVSKSINLPSFLDPVPYSTARIFQSPFTYSFPVSPGQKFVRLYFNPSTYQGFQRSIAFFTVTAGSFTLLSNFSPSLTADSLGLKSLVKEFCLNIEENQVLKITFSPSTALGKYAFINGIEIVSVPTNLSYTNSRARRIHGSASRNRFAVQNNTALEMVLRLNVGGSTISPVNDSGLYRGWLEDKAYFQGSGDQLVSASIRIEHSKTAAYAPAKVYQTARSANKLKSLAWNLTVDAGFTYLVRLHLCDLHPYVTKRGSRKFLIRIGNGKTEIEADDVTWSGGRGIAVYRDYVVKMPNVGNFGKTDLLIYLGNNTNLRALNSDPFLNGLEVFKLIDSQGNLAGPNPASKIAPIPNPRTNKPKDRKLGFIIGGATLAAFTVILLFGLTIFCLLRRGKSNAKDQSMALRGLCSRFTLDELRDATNNFDRALIIGNGGFGRVFKGCIDGEKPVAIKALTPTSTQGSAEFEAEIKMLSDLRHPHIVSLVGYCDEGGVKIIVYDYMPRGTLRDHLYNTEGPPLSWKQRLEICIGVARGLKYLHAENPKIIHRDIKPSNILLDENWVAKVSDFGLSRLGPTSLSRSHVTTGVKGTFGYLDPEYFQTNHLSAKSDVYSFGVVLFEMLCARPAEDLKLDNEQQSLAEWVRQCIKAGKLKQIMDPNLKGEITPRCLRAFVRIALKCLNDDRHKRPTMSAVLKRLEHALELQECADDDASDEEIMSSNGMEVALRPCNNSKVVHSCPTFWSKTISHKELFRFLSDKAGLKWARPPALCGLQALCCAVPGYGELSRDGQMSDSSHFGLYGTPGRATVPILLDGDDTFKL